MAIISVKDYNKNSIFKKAANLNHLIFNFDGNEFLYNFDRVESSNNKVNIYQNGLYFNTISDRTIEINNEYFNESMVDNFIDFSNEFCKRQTLFFLDDSTFDNEIYYPNHHDYLYSFTVNNVTKTYLLTNVCFRIHRFYQSDNTIEIPRICFIDLKYELNNYSDTPLNLDDLTECNYYLSRKIGTIKNPQNLKKDSISKFIKKRITPFVNNFESYKLGVPCLYSSSIVDSKDESFNEDLNNGALLSKTFERNKESIIESNTLKNYKVFYTQKSTCFLAKFNNDYADLNNLSRQDFYLFSGLQNLIFKQLYLAYLLRIYQKFYLSKKIIQNKNIQMQTNSSNVITNSKQIRKEQFDCSYDYFRCCHDYFIDTPFQIDYLNNYYELMGKAMRIESQKSYYEGLVKNLDEILDNSSSERRLSKKKGKAFSN